MVMTAMTAASELPDDPATLKAMLLAERARASRLEQIIKELQRHRFGRRAETLPFAAYGQGQVLASPFKMARVAATIAAGGKMPQGRWVLDETNRLHSGRPDLWVPVAAYYALTVAVTLFGAWNGARTSRNQA